MHIGRVVLVTAGERRRQCCCRERRNAAGSKRRQVQAACPTAATQQVYGRRPSSDGELRLRRNSSPQKGEECVSAARTSWKLAARADLDSRLRSSDCLAAGSALEIREHGHCDRENASTASCARPARESMPLDRPCSAASSEARFRAWKRDRVVCPRALTTASVISASWSSTRPFREASRIDCTVLEHA